MEKDKGKKYDVKDTDTLHTSLLRIDNKLQELIGFRVGPSMEARWYYAAYYP